MSKRKAFLFVWLCIILYLFGFWGMLLHAATPLGDLTATSEVVLDADLSVYPTFTQMNSTNATQDTEIATNAADVVRLQAEVLQLQTLVWTNSATFPVYTNLILKAVNAMTNGAALGATALQPSWATTGMVAHAATAGSAMTATMLSAADGADVWFSWDGTAWACHRVNDSSNVWVTAYTGAGYDGPPVGARWFFASDDGDTTVYTNTANAPFNEVWREIVSGVWNIREDGYSYTGNSGFGMGLPATIEKVIPDYNMTVTLDWLPQTNSTTFTTQADIDAALAACQTSTMVTLADIDAKIPATAWRNEHYWYIDMEERFREVSSTLTETNQDAINYTDTTGIGMIDWQIKPCVLRGFPSPDFSYGVSGEAGTIDQDGLLTMLSAGLVDVHVTNSTVKTAAVDLYYSSEGTSAVRPRVDRVTGSAGYAAITNIDTRIVGASSDEYWLTNNAAAGIHVRNPDCWAASVDLSGVVVSTGGSIPAWHGTLLTTQHIIMAKHAYNGVGTVKRFVGRSGTNYSRTIAAILDPRPGEVASMLKGDYVFARLDTALPTNDVAVYPVLPASYTNQFPTGPLRMPAMIYNQHAQTKVGELRGWGSIGQPEGTNRLAHWRLPYSGDSGRPVFLLLDDGPVFMFTFSSASVGWSSPTVFRAAMDALLADDGAALTDADLSAYTEF